MQSETSETPGPPLMFPRAFHRGEEAVDLFTAWPTRLDSERGKGAAAGSARGVTTQEESRVAHKQADANASNEGGKKKG